MCSAFNMEMLRFYKMGNTYPKTGYLTPAMGITLEILKKHASGFLMNPMFCHNIGTYILLLKHGHIKKVTQNPKTGWVHIIIS